MSTNEEIRDRNREVTQLLLSYFGGDRVFFTVAMPTFDENDELVEGIEFTGNFSGVQASKEDVLKVLEFAYNFIKDEEGTETETFPYKREH